VPNREPVETYLKLQGRFEHLDDEQVAAIQQQVDEFWEHYAEAEG
jgi:pyruvate/2-oxoacid:ferredoxin oxidoreductase beta subunit